MPEFNKNEEFVLNYWKENRIIELVSEKNKGGKPFYFLDGPPFVSGDLHPGQMWVKTMKDVFLRYRRYRGYNVYARAGYDVHGLPIEKKVELKLGISSKKEIESKIGVENFINSCKEYVNAYIGRMDADYNRFGISLDFSNPYVPSTKEYMEIAWGFFKTISDKGLLYEDKKATAYCINCGTAVSQGGVEIDYKDDNDPSIFVAFKVVKEPKNGDVKIKDGLYLLIWTTTPWTLPANVAVAINPKERYVIASSEGKRFVLAKNRVDAVASAIGSSMVIENEFYGSELEGIMYANPLEGHVPKQKELRRYHRVVGAEELVAGNEGSGLVHIAPGHGLEDYLIGKRKKFPIFSPVDLQGLYTEEAGKYRGLNVIGDANTIIIGDLKELGALVNRGSVTHRYPHCWRCDTKLIFIATKQWFINIQKVKNKIQRENRKVIWHPKEAQKWENDVLESSPDWTVSRQRYWGIPMPIWRCECGETQVIGSLDELNNAAINKEAVRQLTDIHRPYVDGIVLACPKCGKNMHRVKDVLDVWFDSSIAYRASLSKDQFDQLYPVDFILEGMDQLRAWFAYQLKMGVMINGRRPFDNVVIDGMMLAEDRREMHKKLGNYVSLGELLQITSADPFRLWCTGHTPELDLIFSREDIGNAERVIRLLYNISNLYKEYSSAIGYMPVKVKRPRNLEGLDYEDAWIIAKLNYTIDAATASLDNYELHKAVAQVKGFIINDFSRLYLRIAKRKIGSEDKRRARRTVDIVNYILFNTLILISPITPFAAEKLYLENYSAEKSIFLNRWPRSSKGLENGELVSDFEVASWAITAILSAREKAGVKLRWPLPKAVVEVYEDRHLVFLQKVSGIIEDYANIKKLDVRIAARSKKEIKPKFEKIGPEFKQHSKAVSEALKNGDADSIEQAIKERGYYDLHTGSGTFKITQEHFVAVDQAAEEGLQSSKYGLVSVDATMSEDLKQEAIVREFERRVQMLRKEMGLRKADKISLFYAVPPDYSAAIKENAVALSKNVGAKSLKENPEGGVELKEFDIEGERIRIGLSKA